MMRKRAERKKNDLVINGNPFTCYAGSNKEIIKKLYRKQLIGAWIF